MKFIEKQPFYYINVDVSTSTEVFFGTVCLIAVRRSYSGRTGCHRCGRVDKTHLFIDLSCSFLICIASLIHLSTLLLSLSMSLA